MTQKDQIKVMKAGFVIIREDKDNLLIKAKSIANTNWHTYLSGFKSYAELTRNKKFLLEALTYIED